VEKGEDQAGLRRLKPEGKERDIFRSDFGVWVEWR
jgi:hypothetical protein